MKAIIQRIQTAAMFAVLFAIGLASTAWAEITKINPVTGETETYANKFTGGTDGTATEWNSADNWDTSKTPFISDADAYSSALVDGMTVSTTTSIDGWNLQVGVYNGASITWNSLGKIQGDSTMWLTVDGTSSITINGWGTGNLGQSGKNLNYYVAAQNGVTWTVNLASGNDQGLTMNYYLAGNGSVSYQTLEKCAHVIKMADVTLTGTSEVSSKTLVSFTSTTKTFTAAADIKVYDGSTLKETVAVTSVRSSGAAIQNTTSELTTADAVGTCELVQCTDGIVLYYVDGDPSAVVAKTYTPSININFTSGTALSTAADVGLAGYAVPGTSWNNLTVANNATLSSLNKIDSTGAATASSASVTITNTRGEWHCSSLVATYDLRAGYIDETADVTTPTVTVSGIPYDQYKVVVYTATDAANVAFGYVTINGTNYTYSDGAVAEGTTAWGASGAQDTANALAEGVNVLVSPVVSGATLTVVGHRSGNNPRGCIAAVQIVKVEQQVGENDLLIELDGDRTYTFDEAKAYSGTVYVTGEGTVTFAGSDSTAATLHIGPAAAVNMVGSSLTPTTVTGNGTVVYDGAQPSTTLGFDNSANWTGTVWVKNVGAYDATSKSDTNLGGVTSGAASANPVNNWGNAYSFVKFTNVKGYMYAAAIPWTLILEDDGAKYAWYNNNGWGSQTITIAGLKGDGTFYDEAPASGNVCNQPLNFTDGSAFLGTIYARGKRIGLGGATTAQNAANAFGQYGSICIPANGTATVSSGKTWSVYGGFIINGTLNDNGTLATLNSSAASIVSGSGTVVFTARLPTPADTSETSTWWKNTDWTGTVWIKSYAISELNSNLYGNEGSTLKFTGVTGYFAKDHVNTVPIELENIGRTAAFNYNNGWGGELLTFSELKGTGTLQTSSAGNGGTIWVKKWDTFTGVMNLGHKQVVMGGDEPDHSNVNRNGKLVIAEGAVVTNLNATTSWTAGGGIEVNGTFAATDRTAWADGTAMTINSTGILNMYGSGVNDTSKSFANVTGTGTIWYSQTTTANDKWSALPSSAANMFANTLSVSNDNVNAGVIITMNGASDVVTTNANISGTGYFRSDWGTGVYRGFLALQSKNTTWSGTFGSSSRIKKFIVAGVDGATDRTLTLAGTQSSTIPLTVESLGSVNITGTYLGATTVAGTFGGTGTLTGNLTFSDGATFKAFASDENGLSVSGTVAYPEEGTVTVDVSDLTLSSSGTTLMTFTSASTAADVASKISKMVPSSGAFLKREGLTLKAYPLVATYNGENYATVQAAIDAAEQAGDTYEDVTILDATAECPAGYYVDTENSNALTLYQAAIIQNNEGAMTTNYFKTAQLAVDAIEANVMTYQYYTHFEVYSGTAVEMTINPAASDGMLWTVFSVKVKCLNSATVTVMLDSTESELTAGDADLNGIVTYTKTDKATTYVWVGTGDSAQAWGNNNKWKVGTSDGDGASRAPGANDTVIINGGAPINISGVTVTAMHIGGEASIKGSGTLTATTGGIVLTDVGASITVSGVTLSPTPTTSVADSYVKLDGSTYSVDAYNTVSFTAPNATVTRTDDLGANIKDGDTITFTVAADQGYSVTGVSASSGSVSGAGPYSYVVAGNATITVTTQQDAQITGVVFDYYVGYTNADVRVTVDQAGTYTLTVGGTEYAQPALEAGEITFENVNVTGVSTSSGVAYTIKASGGASGTTGGTSPAQSSGTVTDTGWMAWSENGDKVGTWSADGPSYTAGAAAFSGTNTYTAAWTSTGEVVTVTTNVKFGDVADPEMTIDANAQAAVRLFDDNGVTFQVWNGDDWVNVSNGTLGTPSGDETYQVEVKLNYSTQKYGVKIGEYQLALTGSNPAVTLFPLAKAASAMQQVSYLGAGSFISLSGEYVSAGYTADVGTDGSATNVVVSSDFVNTYMSDVLASNVSAALSPTNTTKLVNGLNYFASYALGLDPTDEDDKPTIKVETNSEGKFVVTLVDGDGERIEGAANVALTLKFQSGTDPNSLTTETISSFSEGSATIDPSTMEGNVKYYKVRIDIGAK